jgi:hypothetical protein
MLLAEELALVAMSPDSGRHAVGLIAEATAASTAGATAVAFVAASS